MERTNFRYVKPEEIEETIDFASVDVSFISLRKILLPAKALLASDGAIVCLVKPQFEAGRDKVGKKGVVREPSVHIAVVGEIIQFALREGFFVYGLSFSPIKGPEGNIEYLLYLGLAPSGSLPCQADKVVDAAHREL
jgi:23S rRNA (cytidine1920-2'-O)/16S rRNA (cytidine1409-2'-O)-methyltransferase